MTDFPRAQTTKSTTATVWRPLALALLTGCAALASAARAAPTATERPDLPDVLPGSEYRLSMEQVVVVGQKPYWQQGKPPRWDQGKLDVQLKPTDESRLKLFPNYTAEERDEAMKQHNPNDRVPKIKLFDVKF